jgi:hypothetical protein
MLAFAASILSGLYAIFLKFAHRLGFPQFHADFVETPLPIPVHRNVRDLDPVFPNGVVSRTPRAHLSRVAGQGDICG